MLFETETYEITVPTAAASSGSEHFVYVSSTSVLCWDSDFNYTQ